MTTSEQQSSNMLAENISSFIATIPLNNAAPCSMPRGTNPSTSKPLIAITSQAQCFAYGLNPKETDYDPNHLGAAPNRSISLYCTEVALEKMALRAPFTGYQAGLHYSVTISLCYQLRSHRELTDVSIPTPIISSIVSCTKKVMESLNSLEEATIRARGQCLPADTAQFTEIRRSLRAYLSVISQTLQACYKFAHSWEDVPLARCREDLIRLLPEMVELCENCRGLAHNLIRMHEAYMIFYTDRVGSIEEMLRGPVPKKGRSKGGSLDSNGEIAMREFAAANRALHSQVTRLATFFDGQYAICKRYNNAAKDSSIPVSLNEAKQYGNGWTTNQTVILKAKSSIATLVDKVDIHPVVVFSNPPPKKSGGCIIC